MYFKRKIGKRLDAWLFKESRSPALVMGIRQCGKTETIREFARRNHLQLVELNFWNKPELSLDFSNQLDVDTIISNVSLRYPKIHINPKTTLIFFDEIQDCPGARLSFKNFKSDGRYLVIGSGSYLGINGYVIGDTTPTPVGYEDVISMKTMDFEEFLWALGYQEKQIDFLQDCFEKKEPVPENVHKIYHDLFLEYVCIGGFPKVVKEYGETHRIIDAYRELNNNVFDLKSGFGRRKDRHGNALFLPAEVFRIQNVFELIPTFLSKESKRFIVSKIQGGTQYDKNDAIEYQK